MSLTIRKHNTHEETVNVPFTEDFIDNLHRSARTGEISSIQADGDELEHITNRMPNLPHSYRICTWRGELAQFIGENLSK